MHRKQSPQHTSNLLYAESASINHAQSRSSVEGSGGWDHRESLRLAAGILIGPRFLRRPQGQVEEQCALARREVDLTPGQMRVTAG